SAGRCLESPLHDPERWRGSLEREVPVTLGIGRVSSEVELEPAARQGMPPDTPTELSLAALRAEAALLEDAPVIVDARLGLGICGPSAPSAALARAIVVQLASVLSPDEVTVVVTESDPFGWAARLPHTR